jgi:hypothetical protein
MSKMTIEFQKMMDELRGKKPSLTIKQEKTEKRAGHRDVVSDVRAKVFELDRACICGKCPPSDTDEMHELESRAKTRGRPPEERFSTKNCVRLSRKCHLETTGDIGRGRTLDIQVLDPEKGADGKLMLMFKNGRLAFYERKA